MIDLKGVIIVGSILLVVGLLALLVNWLLKRYLTPSKWISAKGLSLIRRICVLIICIVGIWIALSTIPDVRGAIHALYATASGYIPITTILKIIIAIIATIIVAKIIEVLFTKYIKRVFPPKRVSERTAMRLVQRIVLAIVYVIGALIIISAAGFKGALASMLVGAGFAGLVVGMAAKDVLSNIIAGISIIVSRPYRIGDAVVIEEEYGNVEDITLRHTVIKTWDNRRLVIPNSKIDREAVINYTIQDSRMLSKMEVGISYESDFEKAAQIMREEAKKHPWCLPDMEPVVQILGFGDSSVNIRLLAMTEDQPKAFGMACDLRKSIKERFEREGVEIPYPRRYLIRAKGK